MSYNVRAGWFEDGTSISTWAEADEGDSAETNGVICISPRHDKLVAILVEGDKGWETQRIDEDAIELTHHSSGVQILLTPHSVDLGIAYGGPNSNFEIFRGCLLRLMHAGATLYDPQLGRTLSLADNLDKNWKAHQRTSLGISSPSSPVPPTFNRLQYFARCIATILVYLGTIWIWITTGLEPLLPNFPLTLFVIAFTYKTIVLDPPRLRSIGYNERLTFLNLVPPLMLFLQVQLFCYPPRTN